MKHEAKNTRYLVELMSALLVYTLVLVLAIRFAPGMKDRALQAVLMVSPALPIGLAIWAIARHLARVDEYVRQTTLENIAVAAAFTAGASLTYGFMENAGMPKLSMFVVWPVMGAAWATLAIVREFRNR